MKIRLTVELDIPEGSTWDNGVDSAADAARDLEAHYEQDDQEITVTRLEAETLS